MKLYKIPKNLKTIIFDIDGTLYTNQAFVLEQVDVQIRHFADLNGMSHQEAREKIAAYRKQWGHEHGGKKISLGNTFTAFGVDIETSINWRNSLLHPEEYLGQDAELRTVLESLGKKYELICVTNNPVDAARRTLCAIGIDKTLPRIIGLDTCKKSKPAREVLELAASQTGASFEECLSVGDRYDIDLALPLELGMGAVLVDGAEDVKKLPYLIEYANI